MSVVVDDPRQKAAERYLATVRELRGTPEMIESAKKAAEQVLSEPVETETEAEEA